MTCTVIIITLRCITLKPATTHVYSSVRNNKCNQLLHNVHFNYSVHYVKVRRTSLLLRSIATDLSPPSPLDVYIKAYHLFH